MTRIAYRDPEVGRLADAAADLLCGGSTTASEVEGRLFALTRANAPGVVAYWQRTRVGYGVPDEAYKRAPPYLFPDEPPVRTFRTSGTTGGPRGAAPCTARGLELMDLSIVTAARRHLFGDLDRPAVIRLVPREADAPEMVMAHGMELLDATFGHRQLGACVVGPGGLDLDGLARALDRATAAEAPVVLLGASFAFVNATEALEQRGRRWTLPEGSRMLDAGGFKGRSRTVTVDDLRASVARTFGVRRFQNLFGMTELASQLYDAEGPAVGPLGERPKFAAPHARARVRDPFTLALAERGDGLLEVVDLAILDRPAWILTGDRGIATPHGVAIAGRVERGQARGCSLSLDALTEHPHA